MVGMAGAARITTTPASNVTPKSSRFSPPLTATRQASPSPHREAPPRPTIPIWVTPAPPPVRFGPAPLPSTTCAKSKRRPASDAFPSNVQHRMGTRLILAASLCAVMLLLPAGAATASDHPNTPAPRVSVPAPAPLFVGLRRSSYGLRKFNTNDLWWADRAKQFASNFPGSQPLILHILSNYQDDGTTQIEFKKPETYHGSTTNMSFLPRGKLNHERALTTYDQQGVKAILQFEPGSADVGDCFELAHAAFGHHPCVIGLAIDGEWFRTKD